MCILLYHCILSTQHNKCTYCSKMLLHKKYSNEIVLTKVMVQPQFTNLMFTFPYSSCIDFLDISCMKLLFFFCLFDITILWLYIFDDSFSFYFVHSLFIAEDNILTSLVFYLSSSHKSSFTTSMLNATYPWVSRHHLCGRNWKFITQEEVQILESGKLKYSVSWSLIVGEGAFSMILVNEV